MAGRIIDIPPCWYGGLLVVLLFGACSAPAAAPLRTLSAQEWQAVAKLRVFFGHQSVGRNLIDGVGQLATESHVALPMVDSRSPSGPGISHFRIGKNGDPGSKIRDFAAAVEEGLAGQPVDVALMKLCYVDISAGTDVRALAGQYIESLEALARRFPATRFVAVTAPLTTAQTGLKAWGKRLMGRLPGGYAGNARRQEFNTLLRQHFQTPGRLFDLARLESRGRTVEIGGRPVETLDPALTSDGGHLNSLGQRYIAAKWLQFLISHGR